jgi:hypothetical protein
LRRPRRVLPVGLLWLASPAAAEAHIKWFCAYNVAEPPQPILSVIDATFFLLAGVAILVFLVAGIIDNRFLGRALLWSIDRVTAPLRHSAPVVMRATFGGFFIALWVSGGIILTPELKTSDQDIPWLQLLFACCFIWEQTLIIAACGIVGLYGYALYRYGIFHLLDYPVFLGAAFYFAMIGLRVRPWRLAPMDVVRTAAAITLLWASIEKWGYPQWTYPLIATKPGMAMGFTPPFYMKAAGVVEFSLAFALLGTPLMRRTAAIILASMFTAAVLAFGKIDAIGHSAIIAVMLAVAADNRPGHRQPAFLAPVGYVVALVCTLGAYYGLHYALYDRDHSAIQNIATAAPRSKG